MVTSYSYNEQYILIIYISINIDVPKCYIIEMSDALKFVKNVTISSSSNEMNEFK